MLSKGTSGQLMWKSADQLGGEAKVGGMGRALLEMALGGGADGKVAD